MIETGLVFTAMLDIKPSMSILDFYEIGLKVERYCPNTEMFSIVCCRCGNTGVVPAQSILEILCCARCDKELINV